MRATRALRGRLGNAERLYAWAAKHHREGIPGAWYPAAYAVDDNTFEDRVMNAPCPVLLDCWSAATAYEGAGQAAALALAAGVANRDKALVASYGGVALFTLNVDAHAALAAHLGVANTPTVLAVHDGEIFAVEGCVADDVRADNCVRHGLRAASRVYGVIGYRPSHPVYRVVTGRREVLAQNYGEARWSFTQVIEEAASGRADVLPHPLPVPAGEIVSAKAAAGLVHCAFAQKDIEEAATTLGATLKAAPRAVGALADVRRTLAAVNLALISLPDHRDADASTPPPEYVARACTSFLRAAYCEALAELAAGRAASAAPHPLADAAELSMLAYLGTSSPTAARHRCAAAPGPDALAGPAFDPGPLLELDE
eukprot:TRINITY_DN942_c1_g1_i5.p1 TRINITY_DN942_c1_g1~~TRINITY_DN942_c1_g1_i5.p1  ORF type:complete len:370 (+),score=81.54 TRINITY_DN942_c1_g1_i5:758-1867(+)